MPFNRSQACAYQKNLREERKNKGLCPVCGNRKSCDGRYCCRQCTQRGKKYLNDLKRKVIKGYGNKCKCCGETVWQFLSVDHSVERGADERRRIGTRVNSGSFYRRLIKEHFPSEYQCLCFNCNLSLGFYGYCPHHPDIVRPVFKRKHGDTRKTNEHV